MLCVLLVWSHIRYPLIAYTLKQTHTWFWMYRSFAVNCYNCFRSHTTTIRHNATPTTTTLITTTTTTTTTKTTQFAHNSDSIISLSPGSVSQRVRINRQHIKRGKGMLHCMNVCDHVEFFFSSSKYYVYNICIHICCFCNRTNEWSGHVMRHSFHDFFFLEENEKYFFNRYEPTKNNSLAKFKILIDSLISNQRVNSSTYIVLQSEERVNVFCKCSKHS